MTGWFGIRGIGSVFYLLFALRQGLDAPRADTLVSLTLWTVAASIVRARPDGAAADAPLRPLTGAAS